MMPTRWNFTPHVFYVFVKNSRRVQMPEFFSRLRTWVPMGPASSSHATSHASRMPTFLTKDSRIRCQSRMFAVTDMHLQVGNQVSSLWIFLSVSFLTCRWISKLTYMECSGPYAFDSRILWCDERKQHHRSSHQICPNFLHPFEDHFQGNCLFAAGVSPREPAIAVGASMSFGGEA